MKAETEYGQRPKRGLGRRVLGVRVGFWLVLIIAIGGLFLIPVCVAVFEDEQYQSSSAQGDSEARTLVAIVEQIAHDYHETHLYIEGDVFDCDNMACDLWNMLKARGINAEIVLGNVQRNVDSFGDCDHAWVIAEVASNEWLAIECTGGYVVYQGDDPLYYRGYYFRNPKAFRDFLSLYQQYVTQASEAQAACDRYEALQQQFENADHYTQLVLYGAVTEAMQHCEVEMAKLQSIIDELAEIAEQWG